jgi:hypothetical protein
MRLNQRQVIVRREKYGTYAPWKAHSTTPI